MSRNRMLTPAEMARAAQRRAERAGDPVEVEQARAAVEADRQASELPWGWIARAALVVIPLTIAAQAAWHAWGRLSC